MSELTLSVPNLPKLITLIEKAPAISEKHVNSGINRALVRILREEKQNAPFGVTGNLRDNWRIEMGRFEGKLTSGAPYARAVHEGTRPHYVSAQELMPWARKKGLNPYAVAKSIAKKGTKANPFLKNSLEAAEEGVIKEFDVSIKNIMQDLKL